MGSRQRFLSSSRRRVQKAIRFIHKQLRLTRSILEFENTNFRILSRTLIESGKDDANQSIIPKEDFLLISISCPEDHAPNLRHFEDLPNCKGILKLWFDDTEACNDYNAFTKKQAEITTQRILDHKDSAKLVLVHCKMGISRSAAVAAIFSKIVNGKNQIFFSKFRPNRLVCKLLTEAYERIQT